MRYKHAGDFVDDALASFTCKQAAMADKHVSLAYQGLADIPLDRANKLAVCATGSGGGLPLDIIYCGIALEMCGERLPRAEKAARSLIHNVFQLLFLISAELPVAGHQPQPVRAAVVADAVHGADRACCRCAPHRSHIKNTPITHHRSQGH